MGLLLMLPKDPYRGTFCLGQIPKFCLHGSPRFSLGAQAHNGGWVGGQQPPVVQAPPPRAFTFLPGHSEWSGDLLHIAAGPVGWAPILLIATILQVDRVRDGSYLAVRGVGASAPLVVASSTPWLVPAGMPGTRPVPSTIKFHLGSDIHQIC
jgi:hypothetical protein